MFCTQTACIEAHFLLRTCGFTREWHFWSGGGQRCKILEYLRIARLILHGHDSQLSAWQSADRNFIFHHTTSSAQARRVQSLRKSIRMVATSDTRLRGLRLYLQASGAKSSPLTITRCDYTLPPKHFGCRFTHAQIL